MNKSFLKLFIILLFFSYCDSPTKIERDNPNDPESVDFTLDGSENFTTEILENKVIKISWEDTVKVTDYYRLMKSVNSSDDFLLLDTLNSNTTEYLDTSQNISSETRYMLSNVYTKESGQIIYSDSVITGIDFGGVSTNSYSYNSDTTGLVFDWDFETYWPFIGVVYFNDSDFINELTIDTLFGVKNYATPSFEKDFSERYYEIRFYVSEEDISNDNSIGSISGAYYGGMEFIPELNNVQVNNEGEVQIEWEDNSSFEEGFRILRSRGYNRSNLSEPEIIAIVPPNTTMFKDTLNPFLAYDENETNGYGFPRSYYGVEAFKGASGSGSFGEEASIELRIDNFEATVVNNGFLLSWNFDQPNLVDEIEVQYSSNGISFSTLETLTGNVSNYEVTNLDINRDYHFRIKSKTSKTSDILGFLYSNFGEINEVINLTGAGNFRISDSGNLLIISGYDFGQNNNRRLFIYDLNNFQKIYDFEGSGKNDFLNFDICEDLQILAYSSAVSNKVFIVDFGNDLVIDEIPNLNAYDLEFSSDCKSIYTLSQFSELNKYSVQDQAVDFRLNSSSPTGGLRSISVHPNNDLIAYSVDGKFDVIDSTGNTIPFPSYDGGSVSSHVNFSETGKFLSFISHFNSGLIYNVATKNRVLGLSTELLSINENNNYALAYRRDVLYLIDVSEMKSIYHEEIFVDQMRYIPNSNSFIIKSGNILYRYDISLQKQWNRIKQPYFYSN
jgi:hypothetical protein